jgi:GNAT superfamily N-acetyltransferase
LIGGLARLSIDDLRFPIEEGAVGVGWTEGVRRRFEAPGRLEEELVIREGSLRDYQRLSKYHYRAGRPGTVRRVWVVEEKGLRDPRKQGTEGRRGADEDAPPRGRRLTPRKEIPLPDGGGSLWGCGVVGVLVVSMPVLRCRLRDEATGGRYVRIRDARERAALINGEVRCISRVVVDPRWRGSGVAVRLVKHALAQAETVYTEAVAAMGAVHPLFEKAGMTGYRRPAHEFDLRMKAALGSVGLDLETVGGAEDLAARLGELEEVRRRWLEGEMRRWWGKRFPIADSQFPIEEGKDGTMLADWLAAARRVMGGEPGYWIKRRD